jgi:hypothetical protein
MIEILRIETDQISGASRYQLGDGNWYNCVNKYLRKGVE